jgi:hypothetical protein
MRDFKKSEYKKVIGIKPDKLKFIDTIRGKKSKAGKLDEIIEFYKLNKNISCT